jgi:hypothetical protein
LEGVSVFIAMPAHRDLHPQTVISLLNTQRAADEANIPCGALIEPGISSVDIVRSMCVHRFLETPATRLFWIDSDMTWTPDAFMRMLALSGKVDVVTAAYRAKEDAPRFQFGTPGKVTQNEYGCIPCCGSGLGFTVVNRPVIEALVEKTPTIEYPRATYPDSIVRIRHLFHTGFAATGFATEDIRFFRDVEAAGFKTWCDPRINLGHIGTKVYEGSLYDYTLAQQQVAAE